MRPASWGRICAGRPGPEDLGEALLHGAELEGAIVDMLTFTRSGWSSEPAWAWEALGLVVDRPVRVELGLVPRGRGGDALDAMREPLVEAFVAYVELGWHRLRQAERWWHRLRQTERPTRKGVERLLMLLGLAQACVTELLVNRLAEALFMGLVQRAPLPRVLARTSLKLLEGHAPLETLLFALPRVLVPRAELRHCNVAIQQGQGGLAL